MTHFEKIQTDMYEAMKSGEKEKANTLRSIISKLKDKQIEKRDTLTKEEEIKVLQTLVKQRKESIDLYQKGGRNELAEIESKEMDIINSYLPTMMDEDAVKKIVQSVIKDAGASSMADMGKVMPEVMKIGKGLIDGKTAQRLVSEQLG
ncbi:MAG: GatB/YqeY domain-containing protein [Candidatus Neomarinimicrobiota bacterium]|nr:GatB/YqeY domain-containing protein [Candidatus Neomarinimicrobiota bacterium]